MAIRKIGGTYYIDFYVNGSRKTRAVGPSKREAFDAYCKIKAEIREGRFFDRKRLTPCPLEDLVKKYDERYGSKRGWETERVHLNTILAHFGKDKMVNQITLDDVEGFQAARIKAPTIHGKRRSNATVNREVAVLQRLLNKAVDWSMIDSNPVSQVTYLEESAGRTRILSMDEARALLVAANGSPLRPVLVCALSTGMRRDEILGLEWSEVDLDLGVIFLAGSRTKTGKDRYVPINTALHAELSGLHRRGRYVFSGGKRLKRIDKSWRSLCKKAGVEHLHFHDLRHAAVSYMVMAGVPMAVAGEIVGHKEATMTARYTHIIPDSKKSAVEALPRWEGEDENTG